MNKIENYVNLTAARLNGYINSAETQKTYEHLNRGINYFYGDTGHIRISRSFIGLQWSLLKILER